jgi:hypothetical protein
LLLLLAFLLPLAFYLLVLGVINRRPHPLLVPGVWDFLGLLFAASGFLLVGGPGILGGLHERWRQWWLWAQTGGRADGAGQFWLLVSALYFAAVVAGVAWLLVRRRHLTAVYNVEPAVVEQSLEEVCLELGLNPVRSGSLFLFGITVGRAEPQAGPREALQAPHYLPRAAREGVLERAAPVRDLTDQAAILEVDTFPHMNHVTLRWDPADTPLRREVESALARRLARAPGPESELGGWLLLLGFVLLGIAGFAAAVIILLQLLVR